MFWVVYDILFTAFTNMSDLRKRKLPTIYVLKNEVDLTYNSKSFLIQNIIVNFSIVLVYLGPIANQSIN